MTPRKLSESDKQDILNLYQQPGETTSTLADRYGVSNTTIGRVLKSLLSEQDYEALVQQKRTVRPQSSAVEAASELPLAVEDVAVAEVEVVPPSEPQSIEVEATQALQPIVTTPRPVLVDPKRRVRKRSAVGAQANGEDENSTESESQLQLLDLATHSIGSTSAEVVTPEPTPEAAIAYQAESEELAELSADLQSSKTTAFGDLEEDLDDDLDDLDDDLDDDDLDDDEDDDDLDDEVSFLGAQLQGTSLVQVLPLAEATIPKTFYLVVDRLAELITRPLQDFGDLGQIPTAEVQAKTLPIFDNHRVARRFSKRNQRVIKVPDGRMLHKVGPYLQAKGITRLLIDGQVYGL